MSNFIMQSVHMDVEVSQALAANSQRAHSLYRRNHDSKLLEINRFYLICVSTMIKIVFQIQCFCPKKLEAQSYKRRVRVECFTGFNKISCLVFAFCSAWSKSSVSKLRFGPKRSTKMPFDHPLPQLTFSS